MVVGYGINRYESRNFNCLAINSIAKEQVLLEGLPGCQYLASASYT
jgi:hypothetical protein